MKDSPLKAISSEELLKKLKKLTPSVQEPDKENAMGYVTGTWYLIAIGGHRYVCKDKPTRLSEGGWRLDNDIECRGFLDLDRDGSRFYNPPYSELRKEDFNCLDLPEVTEQNSPLEIEIMPSGNVYFY